MSWTPPGINSRGDAIWKLGFRVSQRFFNKKVLTIEAHSRGLSIGLTDDVEQIAALHSHFDWALNEECHTNDGGRECMLYQPFLDEGKVCWDR